MKKADALYSILMDEISNLCDNVNRMEDYWNNLTEEKRQVFDDLSERLSEEKRKLVKCKRDREIYEDYEKLNQYLVDFDENFSDYPGFNFHKTNYIITLSEVIFQNSSVIPDEDVNLEFFHAEVNHTFGAKAYISNTSDLKKTIAWFSPSQSDSLTKLVQYNSNIECWYSLLQSASSINFSECNQLIFYSKNHHDAGVSKDNISALLKLHMASSGLTITPSLNYSKKPSNSSLNSYCPSQSYVQFLDVIGILGEYNNRDDVLLKYLSIFHVIENFMFKEPIVRLERASSGSMFSIRDFKRLYKSVDVDEPKALKGLFKSTFELYFNNSDFKMFSFQLWTAFLNRNSGNMSQIESFLRYLSINDIGSTNNGNFYDFISRVVYQIRCSIVHNKETEFHISSESYPLGCKLLLEDFLLEFLEELIFLLISKDNDLVWYSSDSIKLWDKSA